MEKGMVRVSGTSGMVFFHSLHLVDINQKKKEKRHPMKSAGSPTSLNVPEETPLLMVACAGTSKGLVFGPFTTHSLPKPPLIVPENVNER